MGLGFLNATSPRSGLKSNKTRVRKLASSGSTSKAVTPPNLGGDTEPTPNIPASSLNELTQRIETSMGIIESCVKTCETYLINMQSSHTQSFEGGIPPVVSPRPPPLLPPSIPLLVTRPPVVSYQRNYSNEEAENEDRLESSLGFLDELKSRVQKRKQIADSSAVEMSMS